MDVYTLATHFNLLMVERFNLGSTKNPKLLRSWEKWLDAHAVDHEIVAAYIGWKFYNAHAVSFCGEEKVFPCRWYEIDETIYGLGRENHAYSFSVTEVEPRFPRVYLYEKLCA